MPMSNRSRVFIAIAAISLVLLYVLPLWTIKLIAPQYPEGLGLRITINSVVGVKPNDLNNINNLNHYIGMKRIEPDAIPELRLMPMIVAALVITGLIAAWSSRRMLARTWVAAFAIVALIGLVDFYKWEYDYGHNLDEENAILKVPGMSYQPPLIGSTKLLNFTATSWPAGGGIVAILALGLGVAAILTDRGAAVKARPVAQGALAGTA